jgi:hypothetical protein
VSLGAAAVIAVANTFNIGADIAARNIGDGGCHFHISTRPSTCPAKAADRACPAGLMRRLLRQRPGTAM